MSRQLSCRGMSKIVKWPYHFSFSPQQHSFLQDLDHDLKKSLWNGSVCCSNTPHMWSSLVCGHKLIARYVKLRVTHAPGMPETFSPPTWVSDPDMHHGTCVTHVPRCMSGSLTIGFLWNRWRGKRSRHSQRMRNPQYYVSGKRPMIPKLAH